MNHIFRRTGLSEVLPISTMITKMTDMKRRTAVMMDHIFRVLVARLICASVRGCNVTLLLTTAEGAFFCL